MRLKRRVALGGVQMDSLDNRILIAGVEPGAGKEQISTVPLYGGVGSRVTGKHRDSLDVTVKFGVWRGSEEAEARAAVLEKVMAWAAGGGWLTLNSKPDRRLRVILAQAPGEGDLYTIGNQYTLTFRALGVPYWQAKEPEIVQVKNANSLDVAFGVAGSVETVLEASFKNTSGSTVNSFQVASGGQQLVFAGLGLANNETLHIDHLDNGERYTFRARIESTAGVYRSVLDKRTGSSDDEIQMTPGSRRVTASAGGVGTIRISCYARFL